LRRIFKLCDKDKDGGLNDTELNDFQYICFIVRLLAQNLDGVKKVVRENHPTDLIRSDGSLSVTVSYFYIPCLFKKVF